MSVDGNARPEIRSVSSLDLMQFTSLTHDAKNKECFCTTNSNRIEIVKNKNVKHTRRANLYDR